jgi:hypothetical protein
MEKLDESSRCKLTNILSCTEEEEDILSTYSSVSFVFARLPFVITFPLCLLAFSFFFFFFLLHHLLLLLLTLQQQVDKVLGQMGFMPEEAILPVSSFSGGWKMRIGLGKILLSDPNILLLDEPTNHLDLESVNKKKKKALF